MTFRETVDLLSKSGIENPDFDARELWKKFSGLSDFNINKDNKTDIKSESLLSAVARRSKREPLQYIIGNVGFYREEYNVTPDVLIPRQDTEILVDYAVKHIPAGEEFIDLCTGSGCIAISTLKNTKNTKAYAVDISHSALLVAKENAKLNGVSDRVEFIQADLLDFNTFDFEKGKYYAVLSNPPYVTEKEYGNLEKELYSEPKIALVADNFGLKFYEKLLPLGKKIIKPYGFIAFEIGYAQGEILKSLAKSENMTCEILKDYSGNDRVAVIENK